LAILVGLAICFYNSLYYLPYKQAVMHCYRDYRCCSLRVWSSSACNCSVAGSVNASCDVSGQCACRRHVRGLKCDSCVDGTFNLAPSNVDGCQSCFCFGRVLSCTSAAGFTQALIHSDRSASCPLKLAGNCRSFIPRLHDTAGCQTGSTTACIV